MLRVYFVEDHRFNPDMTQLGRVSDRPVGEVLSEQLSSTSLSQASSFFSPVPQTLCMIRKFNLGDIICFGQ